MTFEASKPTNRRLEYGPDSIPLKQIDRKDQDKKIIQQLRCKNIQNASKKVPSKRRDQKLSYISISKAQRRHCCRKKCLKTVLFKGDIMACREAFWTMNENKQRAYVLNFFFMNGLKSSGHQMFMYLVAGKEVCNSAWIESHGMSRSRFFSLKRDFENGRNTSDTAKGLFRRRSSRSMDAEIWFENYRDTIADKMPDSLFYHLPSCQTKKTVYQTYVEETIKIGIYKPLSQAQFLRMWRENYKRVIIPKTSRFSKCGVCVLLKEHLQSTSGKSERATWLDKKRLHIEQQWEERKKYYKHIKKSIAEPEKYLSLIVDGMDQGKTHLPHCVQKSKIEKGSSGFLPTHVTGVIAHGQDLKFCFVDLLKWPADANTTVNVILTVLKFIKEKVGLSPPVLYLQMDNCFRDCKNIYIFGFCALLVKMGVFRKVKLSYLMVGHTHEDVDQMFSRISATLGKQPAHTLPSLHKVIHASFTPEPISADLSHVWDVKSWLKSYIPALQNHSRHHSFRFQKGIGKNAKYIEMSYRNWSKSNRKEWLPTDSDAVRMLDVVPKGAPSILRPEYTKCPSIADLRNGLQQFSSRLSVDDSSWWLNFIKTEENERLAWQRRTDDERKAAGKAFCLKDLTYREINDLEIADEASAKRVGELERLMDKNNIFPKISVHPHVKCKMTEVKHMSKQIYHYPGEVMGLDSKTFANDPHSNDKRNDMIKSARALLMAVTRLLCIADMADVYRLLASLRLVEEKLAELEKVKDPQALLAAFKSLGVDLMGLAKLSGARQADLKDPRRKEEIAAARAMLKEASKMLLTSSKAYVQHPDVQSARMNRDYVLKQMSEALQTIYGAAQATGKSEPSPLEAPGALSGALDNFDANLVMDPAAFLEKRTQIRIEEQMERILAGARRLSELPTTRATTKEKLLLECANVRTALQELVAVYVNYAQTKRTPKPGDELDQSIQNMTDRTQDLRKQMRVAVADHISDTFLDTLVPLMLLVEAAQEGNQKEVEECAIVFTEGAAKLEEVANLSCSVSSNTEGVKLVRVVTKKIHELCPQVINAARTLAARPRSRAARENMDVFKTSWETQVHLLVDAVDEITGIDEFLIVSENHIGEDVETCIQALKQRDMETFDRSAGLVRGRTERVISVVMAEMENFERGPYTEGVEKTVRSLKEDIIPRFASIVESTVETLSQNPRAKIDEEGVIQTSQLVYDAIRDVRKAVELKTKRYADGNVMGMDEIYTAEVRRQQELAVAKEEAAYQQLQAAGKVHYDIRASGGDDIGGMGVASIKVNGVEYCHKRLGHNVVVLDPAGQFVASRNFDTTTQEGGVAMGRFLDELPEDHIVLIATQETTGLGAEYAGPALERLGAKGPFNPGYRSSWAFAGYTGPDEKPWVREESRPAEQGPTLVSNLIYTPAYEQGKIKIVIRAEGSDDPDKQGFCSIKVNGVERSAKLRGHNIVVLDDSGNFVTSRSFDTGDTSLDEGSAMAKFLDSLPNERIVLIATQDTKGVGVNEAKDTLARVGATGNVNPGPGGSWVFMGYTGPDAVDWVTQMARPRHKGPCVVSEFISLPAAVKAVEEEQDLIRAATMAEVEAEAPDDYAEEENESDDEADLSISERSDRAKMRALPAEEKAKIERLSTELRSEKSRFENMLSQWDESGNEIVVLAKKMCMMMMDMSDFTRGTGSLKTTMDVINAAKRIARSGARMNQLATEVAEKCAHSQSKNDLLAYIQRISLFSHQLTITSRVKADIQTISGVEVVSALESATSLITSAKNLMNAVILTVKASYVASTKYRGSNRSVINWKMKAPGKKPLISSQPTDDYRSRVPAKSTRHYEQTPLQALSEFDTGPRKRTDF